MEFNALTLLVICINVVWIGYDADRNPPEKGAGQSGVTVSEVAARLLQKCFS